MRHLRKSGVLSWFSSGQITSAVVRRLLQPKPERYEAEPESMLRDEAVATSTPIERTQGHRIVRVDGRCALLLNLVRS